MKLIDWNEEKNDWLRQVRAVTFEEILYHLQVGGILDVIGHSQAEKYSGQRIFVVNLEGYAYLVPFVESADGIFLKTIIPSRKMTQRDLRKEDT